MYNRFNFKTAGVKLANPANSYQDPNDFTRPNVNKIVDDVTSNPILGDEDFIFGQLNQMPPDIREKAFQENPQYRTLFNSKNLGLGPTKFETNALKPINLSGKGSYKAERLDDPTNPKNAGTPKIYKTQQQEVAEQNAKESNSKPQDFDWKRLINFNDPYFQYYTMPTALGLGIGGMFGGWKGAMLGGLGSLGVGALAKYLGENYDMTPKSSAPATQTTSPAAPISTSNIA